MRAAALVVLVGLGLLAAAPSSSAGDGKGPAAAPAASAPLTEKELAKVEGWIRDLEHHEYLRRTAATEALRGFGVRGLPLLREAAASRSEETRARARLLVTVMEAGLGVVDESGDDWLTLKGDMGRTSARGEPPASAGPQVRMTRSIGAALADGSTPPDAPIAAAEGALVVAAGDRITAFGSADLSHRWTVGLGAQVIASPVVSRGRVFVGTSRGLTALDLRTSREVWTVDAAYGVGAAPLVSGDTLYACIGDEALVALDPSTGEKRWEFRCPAGSSSPVVAGGRVVVGTKGAEVVALDAATGKPAWRLPVDGMVSFAPAVVGDSVIVGDGGRRLRCVDAETGLVLWTKSVRGRFAGDGPAVGRSAIVVALDSMEVEAFDPSTGARLWSRWMGTLHLSSPALAGGLVIFGSRSTLVAIHAATGDDAWDLDLEGRVSCPVVADRTVFVLAGKRILSIR